MVANITPETLQALIDKQAITEILYRYCRGCDRADEVALRSCFHPGSTHRHGGFDGTSADFCSLALRIILATEATKHLLSNVLIEVDGERAVSESHYLAYHRQADSNAGTETDYFTGGRYLDRFEKRAGVWKIVRRVGLIDFERREPGQGSALAQALRGRRFPDDELYRELAWPGGGC